MKFTVLCWRYVYVVARAVKIVYVIIAGEFLDAVQIFVSIIFLTIWIYFNFLTRVLFLESFSYYAYCDTDKESNHILHKEYEKK